MVELIWDNKQEMLDEINSDMFYQTNKQLIPCIEESKNFDNTENLYIEGDNLDALKLLRKEYENKIKMIYIDPPYNTEKKFLYNDTFRNKKKKECRHSGWLNMIYPRLKLARDLLTDDGVIFISIDDNEVENLKKVCNEIFGESNFVQDFIWQRAFSPKNDSKYASNDHDFVICYAKQINEFVMGRLPRTDEANDRYKNFDNDARGVWISDNLTVKTYSASYDYPITVPSGRVVNPSHGSCWRVSKERFKELVADNRIWFGENGDNVPRLKRFLNELKFDGMTASSLMLYKDVGHSQEGRQELKKLFDDKGYFDGPKPQRLLYRLLTLANLDNNDIVLDFFSGSATTAHAVMKLNAEDGGNRKFIMVQLPEETDEKSEAYKAGYKNICEIGKERIRRASKKIHEDKPDAVFDDGFKVFKIK